MNITCQPFQKGDLDENERGWYRSNGNLLAQNEKLGLSFVHMLYFDGLKPMYDAPLLISRGGSLVVLVDKADRIGLIQTQRAQIDHIDGQNPRIHKIIVEEGWELPGGMTNEGESREKTAWRETLEETGIQIDSWNPLGEICSNPPMVATKDSYWWAKAPKNWKKQVADAKELAPELREFRFFNRRQISKLLARGEIYDARTIAGLMLYFERKRMFVEAGPKKKSK